jgi:hypothetical protein
MNRAAADATGPKLQKLLEPLAQASHKRSDLSLVIAYIHSDLGDPGQGRSFPTLQFVRFKIALLWGEH